MRHRFRMTLLVAGVLTLAAAAQAHHSVAGQFDATKPVTLKGVISKIDWINPHVYVFLDVKSDSGTSGTWSLATAPTAMMRRAGISRESLMGKPGEIVTITAIPARDGTKNLAWINKIVYADGRTTALSADR